MKQKQNIKSTVSGWRAKLLWGKLSLRCLTGIDSRLVGQSVCCSLHERRHKTQFDVVLL